MVEGVSQVKSALNTTVKQDINKNSAAQTSSESNLERSPKQDTLTVKNVIKENAKDVKKSFTGWLIGAGVAIAGLGIYFLSRGKGGKAINEAASDVAQKAKNKAGDVVQQVENKISSTVEKVEQKIETVVEPVVVKTEEDVVAQPQIKVEPETNKQPVVKTETAVPEKAQVQVIKEENVTPVTPQPKVEKEQKNQSVTEIIQEVTRKNGKLNLAETLPEKAPQTKKGKRTAKPKKEAPKVQEAEQKKPEIIEEIEVVEQKIPEIKKDKPVTLIKENVADDALTTAIILSDDIGAGVSKKAGEIGWEIVDEASVIKKDIPNPLNVSDDLAQNAVFKPFDDNPNRYGSEVADEGINKFDPFNPSKAADDIYTPHNIDDDYMNVNGIADDVLGLNNHSMGALEDFTSSYDDFPIAPVDDILDGVADDIGSIFF